MYAILINYFPCKCMETKVARKVAHLLGFPYHRDDGMVSRGDMFYPQLYTYYRDDGMVSRGDMFYPQLYTVNLYISLYMYEYKNKYKYDAMYE